LIKTHLGQKYTCESCGAKFYDLNKSPATCPKCETINEKPEPLKPKKSQKPVLNNKQIPKNDKDNINDKIDEIEDVNIDISSDDSDTILNDTDNVDEEDDTLEGVIPNIKKDQEQA